MGSSQGKIDDTFIYRIPQKDSPHDLIKTRIACGIFTTHSKFQKDLFACTLLSNPKTPRSAERLVSNAVNISLKEEVCAYQWEAYAVIPYKSNHRKTELAVHVTMDMLSDQTKKMACKTATAYNHGQYDGFKAGFIIVPYKAKGKKTQMVVYENGTRYNHELYKKVVLKGSLKGFMALIIPILENATNIAITTEKKEDKHAVGEGGGQFPYSENENVNVIAKENAMGKSGTIGIQEQFANPKAVASGKGLAGSSGVYDIDLSEKPEGDVGFKVPIESLQKKNIKERILIVTLVRPEGQSEFTIQSKKRPEKTQMQSSEGRVETKGRTTVVSLMVPEKTPDEEIKKTAHQVAESGKLCKLVALLGQDSRAPYKLFIECCTPSKAKERFKELDEAGWTHPFQPSRPFDVHSGSTITVGITGVLGFVQHKKLTGIYYADAEPNYAQWQPMVEIKRSAARQVQNLPTIKEVITFQIGDSEEVVADLPVDLVVIPDQENPVQAPKLRSQKTYTEIDIDESWEKVFQKVMDDAFAMKQWRVLGMHMIGNSALENIPDDYDKRMKVHEILIQW